MEPSHLLSDLSSLSEPLCDHTAAMRLVSTYKSSQQVSNNESSLNTNNRTALPSTAETPQKDADLQRASDLVSLHHDVKIKYAEGNGLGGEVAAARQSVSRVLASLSTR